MVVEQVNDVEMKKMICKDEDDGCKEECGLLRIIVCVANSSKCSRQGETTTAQMQRQC